MRPEPTYEELLDQADYEREAQRHDLALREQELCQALQQIYRYISWPQACRRELETVFAFCGQSKLLEQLRGK